MKFLVSELTYLMTRRENRGNLRALGQYLLLLTGVVALFSVVFHVVMLHEGQDHSWITGLYWTLTVMSTLGFGDITFHSDLGRLFSILVLGTGIILLLIVLPFAFIRYFYAPWLEAQLRLRAPRALPEEFQDHVVICRYDEMAKGLIYSLEELEIPFCVIEPETTAAAELHSDQLQVLAGELDSRATFQGARTSQARLVVANLGDAENTSILLTVRADAPEVPIAAFAEDKDAIDILQIAGANHVLPLKHQLGEQLASRVAAGTTSAHVVGRLGDLRISEFPLHNTGLVGRSLSETRLRELTGLHAVACWERGTLVPMRGDSVFSDYSVLIVAGTEDQMGTLDAMFAIYPSNDNPVLVIGGGKVGRATARALRRRDVAVHVIERNHDMRPHLTSLADQVILGDAADLDVMKQAGIEKAPSVVITTADDTTNIYLSVYVRRLNPDAHIVSRITAERNREAIHRAGADFVMSHTTLGIQSLLAILRGTETVVLGEGIDLFVQSVPDRLAGRTLAESDIGAATGMSVIGVQSPGGIDTHLVESTTRLAKDAELLMIGTSEQHRNFEDRFCRD
jgi:Trk K+ transport system NAD-binding subunit